MNTCGKCTRIIAAVDIINDEIYHMNNELRKLGKDTILEKQVLALDNVSCILAERVEECCNIKINN
jgi:hypothetical protein